MHVVSDNGELHWTFSSACCSQCVTAAPLEVISHSIKGDVVWISVHTAGGWCKTEATFDSILDLTNFVMCTLQRGAPHVIITHAQTPLHTLSFHECCSFLQGRVKEGDLFEHIVELWKWKSACDKRHLLCSVSRYTSSHSLPMGHTFLHWVWSRTRTRIFPHSFHRTQRYPDWNRPQGIRQHKHCSGCFHHTQVLIKYNKERVQTMTPILLSVTTKTRNQAMQLLTAEGGVLPSGYIDSSLLADVSVGL